MQKIRTGLKTFRSLEIELDQLASDCHYELARRGFCQFLGCLTDSLSNNFLNFHRGFKWL